MPAAGNWDALLFDFDGVLGDTERAHHQSWNRVLEPFGIQFTWEQYQKQCIGIADVAVAKNLGLPDQASVVARKQQLFREALEESPPFLEETLGLIREVAQHHRIAVVSSSYHGEVDPPLKRAAVYDCFETVVCGDDAERLKPAPDLYLLAAGRMGVTRPLVIEDSDAGVAAGTAAGFEVLRVSGVAAMPRELRARLRG